MRTRVERGRITGLAALSWTASGNSSLDDFIKFFPLHRLYLRVTTAMPDICFYLQWVSLRTRTRF